MVVGAVEIVPLLDAVGTVAELSEAYPDVPAKEWAPYRELYPELFPGTRWRFAVTVYLVRSGGTDVLVDTGFGPPGLWGEWQPEREGLLPSALESTGVAREGVDVVFHTHLHVDHIGWNADEHGAVFFPNARYAAHADALARALEKPDRPHIQRCILPVLDRFENVDDAAELAPGVRAIALPGHYPGHLGLEIESDDARALIVGDIAPHPALLDRPEWVFALDEIEQTPTRAALVNDVVDTETLFVCGHFPAGGIGHVVRRDGRVLFEPRA